MALYRIEDAALACVTVGPAVVFHAGKDSYRIELSADDVIKLHLMLRQLIETSIDQKPFQSAGDAGISEDSATPESWS